MIQFNGFLLAFLVLFLGRSCCRLLLTRINVGHLTRKGNRVPPGFEKVLDEKTLVRMTGYTIDSSRFGSLVSLFNDGILLLIILSGLLPWYAEYVESLRFNAVIAGLLFLAGPAAVGFVLDIPFELYETFVIERKYGFSTISWKLWLSDLLKGLAVSLVLTGILLGSLLVLIFHAGPAWWFWAWILFACFQLLIMWLYPVVIAPLFNRYEPVKDQELRDRIIALVEKAGLKARGIFQVDAGKRSRHTNAYFTGLGRSKRIVLFDTLLLSHSHDELLAVLAHEIGHWKKRHIIKQLLLMEILSLFLFFIISRIMAWPEFYHTFGFSRINPAAGLFLISALSGPVAFFFRPLSSALSRRYEQEADDFTFHLTGRTAPLISALRGLARDNLSNLYPHPIYAWFYYSHPPLLARIARLQEFRKKEDIDFQGPVVVDSP
ncbi:MAG: M48 family metallopeptidase [Deltaproteobacteria bacterium]|nr:M48 family metallopeptidase [Deltaproteobacteria bacterium]